MQMLYLCGDDTEVSIRRWRLRSWINSYSGQQCSNTLVSGFDIAARVVLFVGHGLDEPIFHTAMGRVKSVIRLFVSCLT